MRLNRFLAAAGLGSRRACEELIRQGRIEVNGVSCALPGPEVDPARDRVFCDGARVRLPRRWDYLLMHKPAGFITTRSDTHDRRTVDDLLGRWRGKVSPVGRLDRSTEGLLLFTNNGELANRLLHPRYQQERTYLAWVRPFPPLVLQRQIEAGVIIGPGERSGPCRMRVLGQKGDAARVRIILREGKNREIRRIFTAVNLHVLALRRTAFAGLTLGRIPPGTVRPLTPEEIAELARRTGLNLTGGASGPPPGASHVRAGRAAPPDR